MGNLMKWYQMVTAQPHKATANGGSILIAEPKIERLAVTFAPVQSGSGTPSPSNVRPISGWTGLSARIAGESLIDDTLRYAAADTTVYIGATDNGYHLFLEAGTYTISCDFDESYGMYFRGQNDSSNRTLWFSGSGTRSATFTTEADGLYRFWVYRNANSGGVDATKIKSVTLVAASTVIDYPIAWANEVGTVYGGTVDLVSGVLTMDRAMADLGTLNWNMSAVSGAGYRFNANALALGNAKPKIPTDLSQKMGLVCSMFDEKLPNQYNAAVNGITIYTNSTFQVYDASMSAMSTTEFKTAMSGVQLVYELATPQTYQLTPQAINALRGIRSVFSDAGSVEITYWTN